VARGRSRVGTWEKAHRHLCKIAVRAQNDLVKAGYLEAPDVVLMREAFGIYIDRHLGHLMHEPSPGSAALSRFEKWALIQPAGRDRLASMTAEKVLVDWGPAWITERQERGRRGGQRGKGGRRREWGDRELQQLAALDGLTVREQQEGLGLSRATVERMRAELRARARATVSDPAHDDLMALLDVEITISPRPTSRPPTRPQVAAEHHALSRGQERAVEAQQRREQHLREERQRAEFEAERQRELAEHEERLARFAARRDAPSTTSQDPSLLALLEP